AEYADLDVAAAAPRGLETGRGSARGPGALEHGVKTRSRVQLLRDRRLEAEAPRRGQPDVVAREPAHEYAPAQRPRHLGRGQSGRAAAGDEHLVPGCDGGRVAQAVADAGERLAQRSGVLVQEVRDPVKVPHRDDERRRERTVDERTDRASLRAEVRSPVTT